MINEIPNAAYTGEGLEPQIVLIGNPNPGEYQVTVTGYDNGDYSVRMVIVDVDDSGDPIIIPQALLVGETVAGQIEYYQVDYALIPSTDDPNPLNTHME